MATKTNRVEVIHRSLASELVTHCNYHVADFDLIFAWHVIDNETRMIVYSAPMRELARNFAKLYKRDQKINSALAAAKAVTE